MNRLKKRLSTIVLAGVMLSGLLFSPARSQVTAANVSSVTAPIVVILMENKSYHSITTTSAAPYINNVLIPGGKEFTDYHSIEHPSLPNYLDITSGDNDGCTKDSCSVASIGANNIFNQLQVAGLSAKSYDESMPTNCSTLSHTTNFLYWRKHNPEVFYTDDKAACATDDVPYSSLNLSNLPDFSFVTPNICDDMHGNTKAGCPSGTNANITKGDTWLSNNVPPLVNAGAEVIVVWDESTGTGSQVLCVETGPGVSAGRNSTRYDHFSLLAGLEDYFGVAQLQHASTATPLPI